MKKNLASAPYRISISLLSLATAVALGSSACKGTQFGVVNSVPKATLGGVVGNVTANTPNPCEIDVTFNNEPLGEIASAYVQIYNTGTSPLDLSQVNPTLDPQFGLVFGTQAPIAPGSFGQFQVTFQPYKVATATSSFMIQTDGLNSACPAPTSGTTSSITVNLTGNGIQLSLSCAPSVLDFGNTLINTVAKKSVTLTNSSTADIDSITDVLGGIDADLFVVDNAPATLPAGQSVAVDISYGPLALETRSIASLTFNGSEGETATCNLFGEPVGVALTLAPNPIQFGYVQPGNNITLCTVATNQSNVVVHINSVNNQFNTAAGAFTVSPTDDASPPNPIPYPIAIQPNGTAKVCYNFAPPSIQQYQGQASWQTDDPSGTQPTIALDGWGGGPELTCVPTSVAFGQTLDHSITPVAVLCTNSGTAIPGVNLTINTPTASPIVFSAQFDQTKNLYPIGGLAPGDTAQIDVSYEPTGPTTDTGTLFIQSNGGQGQGQQIPLSGQGLDIPPCQFIIAPPALNFGNVQVGDSSTSLSYAIENVGTNICLVQNLAISNDATSSFHQLSTNIPPDQTTGKYTIPAPGPGVVSSLIVTLDFSPTNQGAFSAESTFSISDPQAPNQIVQLTGTSETTCLVIAPSSLQFGDVGENDAGVICSSAARTFSIFNECQTAATVQSFTVQNGPGDLVQQFSNPDGPPLNPTLTIQPGSAAVIFEMFFQPTTIGPHTAQLLISDGTVDTVLGLNGAAVSTGTETDTFVVGPPKADILFIIDVDDDGDEQTVIGSAAQTFFNAAAGIDYRVAVTTDDDYAANADAEFGRLLPCPTCSLAGPAPTIISPSSVPAGATAADPITAFSQLYSAVPNSAYPTGTPRDEHFFTALYNALEHGPQPGVDFFRPGVFFAAITDNSDDEADSSELAAGNHNPTWYANFFETYFQNPFLFTWNYINPTETKTGTGFSNYLELPPSIQQMISATNGFALNTEDSAWATALTSVWTTAIAAHTYYPLVGTPSEGSNGIYVTRNNQPVNEYAGGGTSNPNWLFEAEINSIVFTQNDPPKLNDVITVTYPIGCSD